MSIRQIDEAFSDYIEIKATRDLLVHNAGRINHIYISKAEDKARGDIGDKVVIDENYFNHCIAVMKRVSVVVQRDIESKFGEHKE